MAKRMYSSDEPLPALGEVDIGKLEAALAAPQQAFGGVEMYPSLPAKAAALLYAMAKNHAWGNGNKRMAMVTTMLFVALNDLWWQSESEDVRAHVTWVAASEARARQEVLAYLIKYFERKLEPLDFLAVVKRAMSPSQNA